MRKLWNDEEIEYLRKNYPWYGAKKCAKRLNRTVVSIWRKANQLGLYVGDVEGYLPLCIVAEMAGCTTNVVRFAARSARKRIFRAGESRTMVPLDWALEFAERIRKKKANADAEGYYTREETARVLGVCKKSVSNLINLDTPKARAFRARVRYKRGFAANQRNTIVLFNAWEVEEFKRLEAKRLAEPRELLPAPEAMQPVLRDSLTGRFVSARDAAADQGV